MSIKLKIIFFLLSVGSFDIMYGQTAKTLLNRALNSDLCLEVNDGGTPTEGLCVDGATANVSVANDLSVLGEFTSLGIDDNATSNAITIDANELVGIGRTPGATFEVQRVGGSTDVIRIFSDGAQQMFTVNNNGTQLAFITNWASSAAQDIGMNGTTGLVNYTKLTSSRRYKEEIRDLPYDTSFIYDLRPVIFRFKNPWPDAMASRSIGYIAEEVSQIAPKELVFFDEDYVDGPREESLHYKLFVVPIIAEMKKLRDQIKFLTARLELAK